MKKSIAFFIFSLLVLCDVFSQGVGAFTQCAGQAIDLGADKTFCEGDSVTLTANGTYDRIVWSNGASTSSITVKTSGTYIVHGLKASTVDLITNGDFHDTIIAFTTDYLKPWGNHPYGQNGNPGLYNIVRKADNAWWDFNPTCYDHTSGNGTSFMFGANGYNSLNKKIWCQTVPVQPGKNYNVSAWATALAKKGTSDVSPARIQIKINNVNVGAQVSLTGTECSWKNITGTWASGVSVSAQVCIYDNNIASNGNDFGLDDISFTTADTCRVSDTIVVTVNPKPVVNLGADIATCAASAVLTVPNTQPSWTYSWSNLSTTNPTTVASAGTYTVEVTDANLCKGTDAIAVDFVSSSKINLGNDTTFCAGVNKMLDAGVGYASYSWTGAKTGSAQTLLADVSGTYYVSASGACSSKDTVVITIQPKPTVNLGADISTCVASVTLHAQPAHAAYLWNDGSTDSTLVAAASGLFWVQVSNALNCTARDSVQVNLGASSSVNLGLDASVCEGTTKTLDAGGGFTSYAWSGAKTGSSQTIIADVAGTYYLEANNGACVAKDTFVLTVNQNPKPLLGNDVTLCTGSSVTFNAGTFASYLWSDASMASTLTTNVSGSYWVEVTDANSCKGRDTAAFNTQNTIALNLGADKIMCSGVFPLLDAGNGFTTYAWSGVKSGSSQQITADIAGDYIVKVTSGLCESIDTIKIDFYAPPSVDLGADKDVCAGSTTTLDAGIFNSYLWSTGETIQTVSKSAGTYWVKVADANSCVAYDTVIVSTVALPQVNIGSDILACVGDVKTIQDNVAQAGLTYSWNDGSTSSSLQITQSGTYTLTVSDANNCTNSDELNATFNSAPQIDLLAGADTALLCEGDIQILDASTSGFGLSYVWYPSKETTTMIGVKKTGDYWVTVSNGSCSASDTVHVEMVTLPQSVLNDTLNANSATYCFAEEMAGVDISAASSDGKPYQYLWSTGATTPTINVTQEGTYSVTVSMANCEVKDNLKLIDYCATTMYLPSAFSPNGDGVNETFFARGNYVDDYKILIFNRWGELIYSSNSFSDSWDGTYAGVKVEQDVYVYKVLYTQHEPSGLDSKKEMIGRVVVLR